MGGVKLLKRAEAQHVLHAGVRKCFVANIRKIGVKRKAILKISAVLPSEIGGVFLAKILLF